MEGLRGGVAEDLGCGGGGGLGVVEGEPGGELSCGGDVSLVGAFAVFLEADSGGGVDGLDDAFEGDGVFRWRHESASEGLVFGERMACLSWCRIRDRSESASLWSAVRSGAQRAAVVAQRWGLSLVSMSLSLVSRSSPGACAASAPCQRCAGCDCWRRPRRMLVGSAGA